MGSFGKLFTKCESQGGIGGPRTRSVHITHWLSWMREEQSEFKNSLGAPTPPAWSHPWAWTLSVHDSLSGKEQGDKNPHTLSVLLLHVELYFVTFGHVGAFVDLDMLDMLGARSSG